VVGLALFDIDGVLTDGKVYVVDGKEAKNIAYEDIDAIFRLKRAGIRIGFITGEPANSFADYVCQRFNPDYFICDSKNKIDDYSKLNNIKPACFVGDSEKDIGLLRAVEYSYCPADAPEEVKRAAKHILKAKRGDGVIREVADIILNGAVSTEQARSNLTKNPIQEHLEIFRGLDDASCIENVNHVAGKIAKSLKAGGRLFVCGNGGSAADAQHFVAELDGRYNVEALSVNTSTLTAIANDYGYEDVFLKQIQAKGRLKDTLIALSTSGASYNVIRAIVMAQKKGIYTIGLSGIDGFTPDLPDYIFVVPSKSTPRIQEAHILILHMLAEAIGREMSL
jgi:D-sedoheptulose 7-phosphate isomerase